MTGNLWIVIPARGGSRGVPRKNVRLLAGRPLITYVIRTAKEVSDPDHIIVITDDDEIDAVAAAEGTRVLREPPTTGRATLDEVSLKVVTELGALGIDEDDIFLTIQPTCPFLRAERIREALALFEGGAGSVLSVVDDRRLRWRIDTSGEPCPAYPARLNRQMLPAEFRETGAIIGCRVKDLKAQRTRIIAPIRLLEVGEAEALDIDNFSDWVVAEYRISRRKVVIRADASETMGVGHAYRAVAMAQELARHHVVIATDAAKPLGVTLFSRFPFEMFEVDGDKGFVEFVQTFQPDLTILDQLDTSTAYVKAVKAASPRVVTFEDLGPGALEADLLVSDLYQNLAVPTERQLTGISNAILAPNFETAQATAPFRERVENVLVVFGGTDPSHLTERTLQALRLSGFKGKISVIVGPGVKRELSLEAHGLEGELLSDVRYMPGVMAKADLAISSAGRTATELISLGIPVLCLCQNEKELTHTHASARFGVINLGLGSLVSVDTLAAHITKLVSSTELRRKLRERALYETAGRSNATIVARIMDRIGY